MSEPVDGDSPLVRLIQENLVRSSGVPDGKIVFLTPKLLRDAIQKAHDAPWEPHEPRVILHPSRFREAQRRGYIGPAGEIDWARVCADAAAFWEAKRQACMARGGHHPGEPDEDDWVFCTDCDEVCARPI